MKRTPWILGLASATLVLHAAVAAVQSPTGADARQGALQRLQTATGGAVIVADHKGVLPAGSTRGLGSGPAVTPAEKQQQSAVFFRDYGALMGITDPSGLRFASTATDALGETHLTWKQFHANVPVFAGTIKTHFDASHQLKAVTGTAIPDITVNPTPSWTRERAAAVARAAVVADRGNSDALRAGTATLYIYREGLAQGVPGENQLAWEIEITDGVGIRDLVYVGAHSGKVIDKVTAIRDDLRRRAFDGHDLAFAPANYPQGAYWLEGQSFPTLSLEANNMIVASKETYDFFRRTFGRDSFDNDGTTMDAIFNRGYDCPNASWNGTFISFCPGLTTDDVTAHEWSHAYTQYTHGLIYQWQPGALNESYSDIWGEVIDQINSRGTDAPASARTADACSTFSPPVAQLRVNQPAAVAGDYYAQAAGFGPKLSSPITNDVVAALDAADATGPRRSTAAARSPTRPLSAARSPSSIAGRASSPARCSTRSRPVLPR
jgi:bacillolysin